MMTAPKLLSLTMTLLVTMIVTLLLATAASMPPPPRLTTKPAEVLDLRCSIPWHLALRERWFSLDGFEIKFHHSGTDKNVTLARISATMVSPVRGEALNLMADARGLVQATDILDPRPPYLTILMPLDNDSMGVYYCEVEYSPSSTSGMKTLTYKVDVNTKFMHETFLATDVCFSGKLIVADEVHVTWSKVASRRSHGADTGVRVERITRIGDAASKPRILVSIRQQDIVDTHRSYGTLLVKLDSPALGVSDSEYTLRLFVEHEQCYPDCVYSCEVDEQRCYEEEEITELTAFENCRVSWILFITFLLFLLFVIVACVLMINILRKCHQCRQKIQQWIKCSRSPQEGGDGYIPVSTGNAGREVAPCTGRSPPASGNTSNHSPPRDTHTSEGGDGNDLNLHLNDSTVSHDPVGESSDIPDNCVGSKSDTGAAQIKTTQPEPRCSTFINTQNHDNSHKSNNLGDVQPLMEPAIGRNTSVLYGFTDRKKNVCVDLPSKQVSPSADRNPQESPQSGQPHQKHLDGMRRKKQNTNNTADNSFNTTQSRRREQLGALSKQVQNVPGQVKFKDKGGDSGSDESMKATGGFTSSNKAPALSNSSDRSAINSAHSRHQSQSAKGSLPSVKFSKQRSTSDEDTNHSLSNLTKNSTEVGSETDTSEDLIDSTHVPASAARFPFPATDSEQAISTGDRPSCDSGDDLDITGTHTSVVLRNEKVVLQDAGNGSRSKTV